MQAHLDTYNKQTSRRKYAKNTDFHNFKNAVWVAREEGAMPPVRDLIPAEDGDEDDSDDEIVAGGQTQNFRCPLSANLLEDPLTKYVPLSLIPPHAFLTLTHSSLLGRSVRIAHTRTRAQPFKTTSRQATTNAPLPHAPPPSREAHSNPIQASPKRSPPSNDARKNVPWLVDRLPPFSTDIQLARSLQSYTCMQALCGTSSRFGKGGKGGKV